MKVKFVKELHSTIGHYKADEVHDVPEFAARAWSYEGYCELWKEPWKEPVKRAKKDGDVK